MTIEKATAQIPWFCINLDLWLLALVWIISIQGLTNFNEYTVNIYWKVIGIV